MRKNEKIAEDIRMLEHQLTRVLVSGSFVYTENMLSDQLNYATFFGKNFTRPELLQALRTRALIFKKHELISNRVNIVGSVILVTGVFKTAIQYLDTDQLEAVGIYSRVYIKPDNFWKLLSHHESIINDTPNSVQIQQLNKLQLY